MSSTYSGDGFSFSLQKNGYFTNNTLIGSRISWYLTKNCLLDNMLSINSSSQGIFCAMPCWDTVISNVTINSPTNQGIKGWAHTEHDPMPATMQANRLTITNVIVNDAGANAFDLQDLQNSNVSGLTANNPAANGVEIVRCKGVNFSDINVINPGNASAYGSGLSIYDSQNNTFTNIIANDNQAVTTMRCGIANLFDATSTDNVFTNIQILGKNKDRSIHIGSNRNTFTNVYAEGGYYAGIRLNAASYCSFDNVKLRNNTESANNSVPEIFLQGNSTYNTFTNIYTESTNTNKASNGIKIDAGSNNNVIGNHINVGAVGTAISDSGT